MERQAAVEQIGLHPLGGQGRLPDRDVADQCGVRQRGGRSGHRVGQRGVQRHRIGSPRSTGAPPPRRRSVSSRAPVEHLADRQSSKWARPPFRRTKSPRHAGSSWPVVSICRDMVGHLVLERRRDEETILVDTVRTFVDRDVNRLCATSRRRRYPERGSSSRSESASTALRARGSAAPPCRRRALARHPGVGPRLDEPGRGDGRAHRLVNCSTCSAPRNRSGAPAADGHRRIARHDGVDRTGRRLRPADHDHHRAAGRRHLVINGSKTWISYVRRSGGGGRSLALEDRMCGRSRLPVRARGGRNQAESNRSQLTSQIASESPASRE